MAFKVPTESYKVHTALREDLNEGWIWIKNEVLRDKLKDQRRIVCISTKNKKKIYCEALYVDYFYLKQFNRRKMCDNPINLNEDRLIFISGWYRQILGIRQQDLCHQEDLTITLCKSSFLYVLWHLWACLQHPQVVVFLGIMLAIMGLGLGGIAVGLGFIAIKDLCFWGRRVPLAFMSAGIIVGFLGILPCLYGIIGFFKRSIQHNTPVDG